MKFNFPRLKKKIPSTSELSWNVKKNWRWFLIIMFVLFLAILFASLNFLGRLSEVGVEPDYTGTGVETIDRSKMNMLIDLFENKALETKVLLTSPSTVVDPAP